MLIQERYRLVKFIGQGGFGKTFLGVDEAQSPPVACVVKQLLYQNQFAVETGNLAFLQQEAIAVFQQQAQRLEELGKHPQIPSLLAHFEQDGYLYLVHEFIDGTNLATVVEEEGTFSEAQIWQLLEDVLPVLKFIHDRQVIHGDIKPENIIRRTPPNPPLRRGGQDSFSFPYQGTGRGGSSPPYQGGDRGSSPPPYQGGDRGSSSPPYQAGDRGSSSPPYQAGDRGSSSPPYQGGDRGSSPPPYQGGDRGSSSPPYQGGDRGGNLVLVDFGAAKLVDVRTIQESPLQTGTSFGSPEYVAPEQLTGKAVFASDLYSLGVTCISLLTGIPPFDLLDVANDSWAWRQYVMEEVSDRLCKILDKLLQNAVNLRFQSADEVMQAINPSLARNAASSPAHTPSQSWRCINTLTVNSGLLKSINSVAISPDDQFLASGGDDKTIRLWNPSTGQVIRTLSGHSQAVNSVAFSSQGADMAAPPLLASASNDKTIKLWNYDTGQEILTLVGHSHAVKSVDFSPDGQIIASGSWDKTIKLWDVNTGEELCTLTGHKLQVSAIAFSPDGQLLASASFDRTVELYSLPSFDRSELCPVETLHATSLHCTLVGHCGHVFAVAFSPNSKTIATASDDNTVKLWDIKTGQAMRTLLGHSWSVVAVTFSSDGETLISGSWDKTVKLWKVSTGEEICTLAGHSDSVCAVATSSISQLIASGSKDKTARLWQRKEI